MPQQTVNIIGQIVGLAALAMVICSFQQNDRKKILFFQIIATSLFTVHFLLLGAYSGAAMNFVCAVRSVIFYDRSKKWVQSPLCPAVFALVSVALGALTWAGPATLLPMMGNVLTSLSFWAKDPKNIRRFTMCASPLWMIYNIIIRSFAGIMTEVFVLSSIFIAMIRFDFGHGNKQKK